MANVHEQGRSLGPDQMDYGVFLLSSPSVAREDKFASYAYRDKRAVMRDRDGSSSSRK